MNNNRIPFLQPFLFHFKTGQKWLSLYRIMSERNKSAELRTHHVRAEQIGQALYMPFRSRAKLLGFVRAMSGRSKFAARRNEDNTWGQNRPQRIATNMLFNN